MRMIVDGLLGRTASMGSPGVDDVQWRRPAYAGDDLRLDAEVLETRPSSRADRGYVRFRFTMSRVRGGERERVMLLMSSNIIGREKENA
jgi:acyl dehydratase